MNTALWVVQGLLVVAFGMSGFMKATQPYQKLVEMMKWAEDFSPSTVKVIGMLEFLGALGVILPAVTGILPELVPIAATGLVLTMLGAILTHVRRQEYAVIVVNLVLLSLAAFVAYGRFVTEPL